MNSFDPTRQQHQINQQFYQQINNQSLNQLLYNTKQANHSLQQQLNQQLYNPSNNQPQQHHQINNQINNGTISHSHNLNNQQFNHFNNQQNQQQQQLNQHLTQQINNQSIQQNHNQIPSQPINQTNNQPVQLSQTAWLVCGTRFEVSSRYRLVRLIGHGAYGVVCSAVDQSIDETTGQPVNRSVAIKKITKAFCNLIEMKRTLREVRLLRQCRHSNILSILDIVRPVDYASFEDVYIVSELLSTDLHAIITSQQALTNEHTQYFIYQILRALKYLHSGNVIHRDLKPSNLLLNSNCDLKIADFGLARWIDKSCQTNNNMALDDPDSAQPNPTNPSQSLTEYVATRWYRAPEIMLSWREYTEAIDIWSVGCILAEILARRPLFPGADFMNQLHLILDFTGSPSDQDTEYIANEKAKSYVRSLHPRQPADLSRMLPRASPEALDLLSKMLTFNPAKRISASDALKHPYLHLLHDPDDEPVADRPFEFEFEQATNDWTAEQFKQELWKEIVLITDRK